jgi:hypothetical protein
MEDLVRKLGGAANQMNGGEEEEEGNGDKMMMSQLGLINKYRLYASN